MASLSIFFLSKSGLAELLGVSTRKIDRMDAAGQLPLPRRLGARKAWLNFDIEQWIESGCPALGHGATFGPQEVRKRVSGGQSRKSLED